jgi:uncharacterized repeat protein (TIGR03803 family)
MRQEKFWFTIGGIVTVLAVALMLPTGAVAASKYKVLHRFNGDDGSGPSGRLTFDAQGNLYGTAQGGGDGGHGVVFELMRRPDGRWKESVLYSFAGVENGIGEDPTGGVTFDGSGNLYGTALGNGGIIFELTPNPDGSWTTVAHGFSEGSQPFGDLIFDAAGNLYGTTSRGGNGPCHSRGLRGLGCGTVYQMTPNPDGSFTENVLYNFTRPDGRYPLAGVILDPAGNVYGTTSEGGDLRCNHPFGCGVVFKLKPNSDGTWTESVLYRFAGAADGRQPQADLILDAAGNLYGTTLLGGSAQCGCGVIFRLTPNPDGTWTESVLHTFQGRQAAYPNGLIFDKAGNLYGTTNSGGPVNGGVVFKMTPQSDGSWAYRVLHVFLGKPALYPSGDLILDKAGNLYGTTAGCGSFQECQGVVFEIAP